MSAQWVLIFLRAPEQCACTRIVSTRAQGNLSFCVFEDASPVAEFYATAFIAYILNKHVQASREFIIATTQAAIYNRIACQCGTRIKCPGTQQCEN
jgi:hypothetical protein